MIAADSWRESATCREVDPDLFFPEIHQAAQWAAAKEVCARCPVRLDCLDWAMKEESGLGRSARYGVLGGLSPQGRWLLSRNGVAA